MDKQQVLQAVKTLRKEAKEKKFSQSVELIINLKDINIKKAEHQVEFFVNLPHRPSKSVKICALTGPELTEDAKRVFDKVIPQHEFDNVGTDKKEIKKLASGYDYFVAQANIMPKVAQVFGRVLGPRGKMPNPKAGCVLAPKGAVEPVKERLQRMVKVSCKKIPVFFVKVGDEKMSDDYLADNIVYIYNQAIHHLPLEENNVRSAMIKLTMGKPVKL